MIIETTNKLTLTFCPTIHQETLKSYLITKAIHISSNLLTNTIRSVKSLISVYQQNNLHP